MFKQIVIPSKLQDPSLRPDMEGRRLHWMENMDDLGLFLVQILQQQAETHYYYWGPNPPRAPLRRIAIFYEATQTIMSESFQPRTISSVQITNIQDYRLSSQCNVVAILINVCVCPLLVMTLQ